MADKKDLDPNPPAEDRTFRPLKNTTMAERSLTGFDVAHEFESEPEFKKQRLQELQRKAYYSVLRASKAETSPISYKKSQIIHKLVSEWKIDLKTCISVANEIDISENNATWSPNSVPKSDSSWGSANTESLVGKQIRERSPDEDDLPTKLDELNKQAYNDVLQAFNAESPALSSSRIVIMQDLLDECNSAHRAHISATTDDDFKAYTAVIVDQKTGLLRAGFRFRPSDDQMANDYLRKKALGLPIIAVIIPEECHDIFSKDPRDLPGSRRETHWYYYCMKSKGQDSKNLWTRIGEDKTVFDEEGNGVGIKRTFTLTEQEEESNDIFLADEEEPLIYEWFMDEISLPSNVADTDLVMCHIMKTEKRKVEEEMFDSD